MGFAQTMTLFLAFLCTFGHILDVQGTRHNPYETFEELYKKATGAYLEESWQLCINSMISALDDFSYFRSTLIHCRRQCRIVSDSSGSGDGVQMSDIPSLSKDLGFLGETVRMTLCLMKCKHGRLGPFRVNLPVDHKIEELFDKKVPYDYLQLCHYKVGNIQQAASAAYTFLSWNPDHEVMKYNFKFYATLNLDMSKVKNLETQTFQELYLMGNEAYNSERYHEVMHYIEMALEEYFIAEDDCRALCEGPFEKNGHQDFFVSIANHFAYTIKCKQKCQEKLSFMYGEQYENYLASHFHYLQFAYFKVGEIRKACQAVATYLLFHPDDKTMKRNRDFYLSLENVQDSDFTPTEEAIEYWKRDKAEKELLVYIKENYKFGPNSTQEDEQSENVPSPSKTPVILAKSKGSKKKKLFTERGVSPDDPQHENVAVIMGEKELNGTLRFVADGFATPPQCSSLLELAQVAAVNGDGYNGKKSPHTEHEKFEGLTAGRAAILAKLGLISANVAQLLLEVSEKGRDYVEKYFNLKQDLFFTYTHLVCRTAIGDSSLERVDLSHPLHADNCLLQPDGTCIKEKPAFTYRDYSAIIYLNEDFDGGEFIFAKNRETIQAKVQPKCGRLVGFSAGHENLHGVQAVVKGRRCALAMWYTLDHKYRESERELAQQILQEMLQETNEKDNSLIQPLTSNKTSKVLADKYRSSCSWREYLIFGDNEVATVDTRQIF